MLKLRGSFKRWRARLRTELCSISCISALLGACAVLILSAVFKVICGYGAWYPYAAFSSLYRIGPGTLLAISLLRFVSCVICGAAVGVMLSQRERWRCAACFRASVAVSLSLMFAASAYAMLISFMTPFFSLVFMTLSALSLAFAFISVFRTIYVISILLAADLCIKCYTLYAVVILLLTN